MNLGEKRKIILDNFNNPTNQLELGELEKTSKQLETPFSTFRNLAGDCGDILHLLILIENSHLKKIYFAGQQSCLITVAAANILATCLAGQNFPAAKKIINYCWNMSEGKEYNLDNCPALQAFSDITRFPSRVECLKLVIRGAKEILQKRL